MLFYLPTVTSNVYKNFKFFFLFFAVDGSFAAKTKGHRLNRGTAMGTPYYIPPKSPITIRGMINGIASKTNFTGELYSLRKGQIPPPYQGDGQVFVQYYRDRWHATLTKNGYDDQRPNPNVNLYECFITRPNKNRLEAWLVPYDGFQHMERLAIVHFISFEPNVNVAGDLQHMTFIP